MLRCAVVLRCAFKCCGLCMAIACKCNLGCSCALAERQCLHLNSPLPHHFTLSSCVPQVVSCACDLGTFVCGLLVAVLPANNPHRT